MKKDSPSNQLAEWLSERSLDLMLRRGEDDTIPDAGPMMPAVVAIGDLRLLAGGSRPCYGVVLPGEGSDFRWLPCSPYQTPANEKEWKWRERGAVSVLQLWNLREVSRMQLDQSWCVEQLDFASLQMVLQALQDGPASGLGPKLVHPLDPRHEYMDECYGWVDSCLGECVEEREPGFLQAAEEQEDYDPDNL